MTDLSTNTQPNIDVRIQDLRIELDKLNAICGGEWYLRGKGYGEFGDLPTAQGARDKVENAYVQLNHVRKVMTACDYPEHDARNYLAGLNWAFPFTITIEGRRWFDSTYGNTYHSVRVWVDETEVGIVPMTYGYGDQYLHTAYEMLQKRGYLPEGVQIYWRVLQDLGIEVSNSVTDGRKRDLHKRGME